MLELFNHSASEKETTNKMSGTNALEIELELETGISKGISTTAVDLFSTPLRVGADKDDDQGVFLTWKDLRVSVPDGKNGGNKPILQDVTGFAQPGELLAIMGPSGCGKSTLLDALAGRLSSSCSQAGEILINGRRQALPFGRAKYVTQDDTLVATLTVGEAVYYSALLQLPNEMPKSEKKKRAEMTIREMGLQEAINTRIGGWGCKGISGGQKRRVSICIEILTRPKLLFLDEPTSGLDSATSHNVMERIASLAKKDEFRMTVLASIHQPSVEVLHIFDNLCLLASGGKLVYFGPASATNEFFSTNGFPCSLQNPCDHFLRIINKDFDEDLEQGLSCDPSTTATDEVIELLFNSYKSSNYFQEVQQRISGVCKQEFKELKNRRTDGASFLTHCLVLTRRSFVNMYRDPGYYWVRLAVYIGLAFGVASLYYDLGLRSSSIQARGFLLMFVSAFLTVFAMGGFPSLVEEMKVFERERRNGQYGASAFTLANMVSSTPYLLLISLIPCAIIYSLTGLHHGLEHFGYFAAALFCSMIAVESLMVVVASAVPNYLMGIVCGLGIMGLMVLAAGFFRLPNDIPAPFWKYPMYYISIFKYVFQGLYKNEFRGLSFADVRGAEVVSGEQVLRETWQVDMEYSKWVDLAVLLVMAAVYRVLFLISIKISESVKPVIARFMAKHANQFVQENSVATSLQVYNQCWGYGFAST